MDSEEYRKAKTNADEVNMTVNQYAKKLAVDVTQIKSNKDQEYANQIKEYKKEILLFKSEIRRIGNNINQIARAKNLELHYNSSARDNDISYRNSNVPDLDIYIAIRSGEDKKIFQSISDELKNIRIALERLENIERGL